MRERSSRLPGIVASEAIVILLIDAFDYVRTHSIQVNVKTIQRARLALLVIFFLHGAVFATWVSRIPAVASELHLSPERLGLALLGTAVGCLISMPVSGYFIGRVGSRPVTTVATLGFCAALALPGLAHSQWTLGLTLCVLGLAAGAMDVSMNSHGVAVERLAKRPLMSGLHAFFSLGGMAGAAAGGFAAARITPRTHFAVAAVIFAVISIPAILALLPGHVDVIPEEHRRRLRVSTILAGLSALAFCFFLAEGAVADWSALYLHGFANLTASTSALGYALFSATMTIGRLGGDALRRRFAPDVLIKAGSVTAASGLALALALPPAALVGFAIVGAGCSIVVPIVFAAAGTSSGSNSGPALALVTACGYLGLFAGPPAIGFAAGAFTLRVALWIVVALTVLGILLARVAAANKRVVEHQPATR